MPISSLLGLVLIGSCIVFIMTIVGAGFLVLRRLSTMGNTIVQLQTTSQEAQNAAQQLRTSTNNNEWILLQTKIFNEKSIKILLLGKISYDTMREGRTILVRQYSMLESYFCFPPAINF